MQVWSKKCGPGLQTLLRPRAFHDREKHGPWEFGRISTTTSACSSLSQNTATARLLCKWRSWMLYTRGVFLTLRNLPQGQLHSSLFGNSGFQHILQPIHPDCASRVRSLMGVVADSQTETWWAFLPRHSNCVSACHDNHCTSLPPRNRTAAMPYAAILPQSSSCESKDGKCICTTNGFLQYHAYSIAATFFRLFCCFEAITVEWKASNSWSLVWLFFMLFFTSTWWHVFWMFPNSFWR